MLTGRRTETRRSTVMRETTPTLTSFKSKVQQWGTEDLAILVEHKVRKQRDPEDIWQTERLGLKLSRRIQIDLDDTGT